MLWLEGKPLKLSVGPGPSNWGTAKTSSFYEQLAQSPVDYVYLGETACEERSCFSPDLADSVCDQLTRAGKKVYASSLVLVNDEKQYETFDELAQRVERIEINSPAFLALAQCYPAVSGSFLNVYNSGTARLLAEKSVERIVLPCELSLESIRSIAQNCPVPTEVVVHGYLPIALSHDCATARAFGRNRNDCQMLCKRYPEGMVLEAGNRPMFRIEGPQTLSAPTYCLLEYLWELDKAGVDTIRILPQWDQTASVLRIYREVLDHSREAHDGLEELKAMSSASLCNGWFLGKAGWLYESPN